MRGQGKGLSTVHGQRLCEIYATRTEYMIVGEDVVASAYLS